MNGVKKRLWAGWAPGLIAGACVVTLLGCSDSGGPTDPGNNNNDDPKTVIVNVADFAFTPSTAQILVGDTIRWVRQGGTHTTTSGGSANDPASGDLWNAPLNAQNTTFERVFDQEGTFPYFCLPHEPSMRSSIVVSAR